MSSWIVLYQSLLRHRKTLRAVTLLGMDRHAFIGHVVTLWCWAIDNVPSDGSLGDLTDFEIAAISEVVDPNFAKRSARLGVHFVKVLTEVGFIDSDENGRRLHDWYDYAGRLNDKRAENRERMRRTRATHVQRTNSARAGAIVSNLNNQITPLVVPPPGDSGKHAISLQENPVDANKPNGNGTRSRREKPEPVKLSVSDEFTQAMKARYADVLGPDGVKDEIDRSLAHQAAQKYALNVEPYVKAWLGREAREILGRNPGRSVNGHKKLALTDFPEPEPPKGSALDVWQTHSAWEDRRERWWQVNNPDRQLRRS